METGGTQTVPHAPVRTPGPAEDRGAAWSRPHSGSAPTHPALLDAVEIRITRAHRTGEDIAEGDRPWPGRMRHMVRAKLRAWQRDAWLDSAELLVTELTTNAFQHGTAAEVGLRLLLTTNCIVIEVDDGTPAPPRPRTADPLEESGRGLPLVAAVSDAWGTSPDGTRTWCTLNIRIPGRTPDGLDYHRPRC